jgi:hypothetical protein
MDTSIEKVVKIRREKKSFVIEQNVDALQWPMECATCGAVPKVHDNIRLEKKFKNFGMVKTGINDIPYCEDCFRKEKSTRRLDKLVNILSLIFGIPLGFLLVYLVAKEPGTKLICLGLLLFLGVGIAYGFFWLLIRFPVKAIFKHSFVDYVDAFLLEEKKSDGIEGLSISVSIPRVEYAEKFAVLNHVPPGGVQ